MFFWFPKGCSWAGHKKGTTFLGSQDTDDPMHENDFLLYTKTQEFCTKIKIPLLFTIYWGPGGCQDHLVSFLGPCLFRPGVHQWCLQSFKTLQSMHHRFMGIWGSSSFFITGQGQINKIISVSEWLWGMVGSKTFTLNLGPHRARQDFFAWKTASKEKVLCTAGTMLPSWNYSFLSTFALWWVIIDDLLPDKVQQDDSFAEGNILIWANLSNHRFDTSATNHLGNP